MGDLGLISGSGRSPGGGHGNPLQHSCLENFMDGGTPCGHKESDMTKHTTLMQHWMDFKFINSFKH